MLGWLRERIAVYQRDIPKYIVKSKIEEARAASGALAGYEEILNAMMEEPQIVSTEDDEPFHDPAERPSLKEKP